MTPTLEGLQPTSLWSLFGELCRIPRPSGMEDGVRAWLAALAERHGFALRTDAAGNVVIDVPASAGREAAPAVVLQAHVDMVGEKNDGTEHDFRSDPIRPVRRPGGWIGADGTTLGADNGIGVAAALAVAVERSVLHGPLELLFTVDEEVGLTGAGRLDASMVRGRRLINLDSEEEGKVFVGCAGGADVLLSVPAPVAAAARGASGLSLTVRGLRGGHSGMTIHENRGNAVKLLVRALLQVRDEGVGCDVGQIVARAKTNAIPREARAALVLPAGAEAAVRSIVARVLDACRRELAGGDDALAFVVEPSAPGPTVVEPSAAERLLALLAVLPHGVLAMSRDVPGLVETSANLASVEPIDGGYRVATSVRSSMDSVRNAVVRSIRAAAGLGGATAEERNTYPGWKPDPSSDLVAVFERVHEKLWRARPEVTAIHAGLECGILGRKLSGVDMISFGPRIEGAHSPDERVHVESVGRFWTTLGAVLDELSRQSP